MLLLLCIYVVIFLIFTHKYEIYWINFLKKMLHTSCWLSELSYNEFNQRSSLYDKHDERFSLVKIDEF